MATLHNLSVLTNSCVKSPINPKTGLSQTIDERAPASLSYEWHGRDVDFLDDPTEYKRNMFSSKSVNFDTSIKHSEYNASERLDNKHSFAMDKEYLHSMPDADFYEKLSELRAKNQKTLDVYEKLYNGKLLSSCNMQEQTPSPNHLKVNPRQPRQEIAVHRTVDDINSYNSKHNGVDDIYLSKSYDGVDLNNIPANSTTADKLFEASYRTPVVVDKVKDMTATKPPTGRQKTQPFRSISPAFSNTRRMTTSNAWELSAVSSEAETEDEVVSDVIENESVNSYNNSRSQAVNCIEEMWNNFSVDDYSPITRGRSNSLSAQESTEKTTKEWRNRITIPKPFKMTLRDENKAKSQSMVDLENELVEKQQKEENEILKQFKARPVPAHVYVPLYDEIMEEKETKRRQNKQHCEMMLKSAEKPFNFLKREEEKVKCRSRSMPLTQEDKNRKQFKAQPFPAHLFDERISDRIHEEEGYRQIRMQMRSDELLHSSSLPPNMNARGKDYTAGRSRQKMYAERAKKAGLTVEHKFKPSINGTVPEFDEVHRRFEQGLRQTKQTRQATICKPFKLRTSAKKPEAQKKSRNTQISRPRRNSYHSSNLYSDSRYSMDDSIPMKMTAATQLRASATQSHLRRSMEMEEAEQEAARRRRAVDRKLKKQIAMRAEANDSSSALKRSSRDKLNEFKRTERMRAEEYHRELDEIRSRVEKRPLLFERESQTNAQRAAERKYKETLRRAGIDEDFIIRKGTGTRASVTSEVDEVTSQKPSHHSTSDRQYTEEFDDELSEGDEDGVDSVSSYDMD